MVTPRYLPHIGGVERYVHEISTRLAREGVDVTVLTTDPSRESPPREAVDGVEVVRVPAWPRHSDYHFAPDVYRVVSAGSWDLVHVQSYHTFVAPLAMLAGRRRRSPYVVTFHAGGHSSCLRRSIRGFQWTLLRPLLAGAARLVAITPSEIDRYSSRLDVPRERFVLIPLATDLSGLERNGPVVPPSGSVIASVGRLERYKGHHRLIQALPGILERRPDARVWIAGSGPYETKLRRLARKLGVSERVEIRAVAAGDRRKMAHELSKASLVVLLSEFETQPAAALEAIAVGRPVLVLGTNGLSDLADRGLARAIPRDSTSHEIAAAVVDQFERPLVPARIDLPTWDDCARRHVDLYRSVWDDERAGRTSCVCS
jgi:glycosyltransferase involved in cell wall biosynthesis